MGCSYVKHLSRDYSFSFWITFKVESGRVWLCLWLYNLATNMPFVLHVSSLYVEYIIGYVINNVSVWYISVKITSENIFFLALTEWDASVL